MHEMSIVQNIIDIVTEESNLVSAEKINEVVIEIGSISGVEISALEFAFELAVKNTLLENTFFKLVPIPAKAVCLDCCYEFCLDGFYKPCSECGSLTINILQGKELKIKSINID